MPNLTLWGDYPYPTGPEDANLPADFMALAEALDIHTVLTATSSADRDSKYAGIPAGALVTCAAAKTTWLSLGSGAWTTLYSDSGWVTSGFTMATGWSSAFSGACKMRRIGAIVNVTVQVEWSGATLVSDSSAGMADSPMLTLSTNRPSLDQSAIGRAPSTSGTVSLSATTGLMTLKDLHSGSTLPSGQYIQTNFIYMAD